MIELSTGQIEHMTDFARRCIGTSFHHQGRTPMAGLDCIGLVVIALRHVGIDVVDRTDYGMRPDGVSLLESITAHGAELVSSITQGDLLVFRYDHQPQHVALASSDNSLIHAFAPAGRVVESAIGAYWRRRLVGIYRFPRKKEG